MTRKLICSSLIALFGATLAGCVAPATDQPVRILRSNADDVVLHGLIDATRNTPPARYGALAQGECAAVGKQAVFVKMEQKSTFGFDVTYRCISKA